MSKNARYTIKDRLEQIKKSIDLTQAAIAEAKSNKVKKTYSSVDELMKELMK